MDFLKTLPFGAKVCLGLTVIVSLVYNIYDYHIQTAIQSRGILVRAEVSAVTFSRGYITDLRYVYNGKGFTNYTSGITYRSAIGDTVLIKLLPEEPAGTILFIKRITKNEKW